MIGLQLKLKAWSPIDLVIGIVEVLSFVLPVVSIPVWALANARATRRLARAAVNFYAEPPADTGAADQLTLPPRAKPWTRRLLIATVVPLGLALGVVFGVLLKGRFHNLHWAVFALSELALVTTFGRLIQLTGGPAGPASPPHAESGAWSVPSGPSTVYGSETEEIPHRLRRPVSVLDVDLETRTGHCVIHGEVEATRERPRLEFPFILNAVRRFVSRWRPFRCPNCRERVTTG